MQDQSVRQYAMNKLSKQVMESKSIFQMIYDMNKTFGTQQFGLPTESIACEPQIYEQLKNVDDEFQELLIDGIEQNNMKEVADALGDILTFAYGAFYMFGIDSFDEPTFQKTNDTSIAELYRHAIELKSILYSMDYDGIASPTIFKMAIEFVFQWATNLDIDIRHLMEAVTISNYTKLMFDEWEVTDTFNNYHIKKELKDIYFKLFVNEDIGYYWVIYSGSDQKDNTGKAYRANKFLKSTYFEEPKL